MGADKRTYAESGEAGHKGVGRTAGPEREEVRRLIRAALEARERSYSPYSHYRVGAALLTGEGKLYTGCNIENAAFTPTVCAERVALFKAVSEGERRFAAIAVTGSPAGEMTRYSWPCGVCRQALREFCDPEGFWVIVAKSETEYEIRKLAALLPESFGPEELSGA